MKYISQNCCDKTVDDKMTLYREFCFPNCTKVWLKAREGVAYQDQVATALEIYKEYLSNFGLKVQLPLSCIG